MRLPKLNRTFNEDCVEGMRKRLPEGCVDLAFTSPPYADLRDYLRVKPDDYVGWFLPAAYEVKRVLAERGSFVVNINDRCRRGSRHLYVHKLVVAMVEIVRMPLVETYIWHKPNPMPGAYGPRPKDAFEYVFWFGKSTDVTFNLQAVGLPRRDVRKRRTAARGVQYRKSGRRMNDAGTRRRPWVDPGNVVTCPVATRSGNHPAVMPEDLARFFILLASNPGDLILDPFMGSGTTGRAAEELGRKWVGFEMSGAYAGDQANSCTDGKHGACGCRRGTL